MKPPVAGFVSVNKYTMICKDEKELSLSIDANTSLLLAGKLFLMPT